jgi:hypothetical protein
LRRRRSILYRAEIGSNGGLPILAKPTANDKVAPIADHVLAAVQLSGSTVS